jgi:hypothetical protein
MNVAARPVAPGKTRSCPHCKATILESLSICPGCLHHLRFDQEAARRQVAAKSALRVDGVIQHPNADEPWEYYVTIAVRNERGEEVARQVVGVGALQGTEKRTFTLSVEVLPPQAPPAPVTAPAAKPGATPSAAGGTRPAGAGTPPGGGAGGTRSGPARR